MSDPFQETTETNSSRRKGMEAWAASIAARQRPPAPPPGPEQDQSGPGYSKPGASQRPLKVKTVTNVHKSHHIQKNTDGVVLSRNNQGVESEISMKEARKLVKSTGKAKASAATESKSAPAPPPMATQAPEVKTERAIQQATTAETSKEAQTVTVEEVQQSPGVAVTVGAKSIKASVKAEKVEDTSSPSDVADTEEEKEPESLIKPGNDTRASAYVRAGDYLPDGGNPDLDDYVLAL